jgi:hypothetical protein
MTDYRTWIGEDGDIWGTPIALALRHLAAAEVPTRKRPFGEARRQFGIDMFMVKLLTGKGLPVDDLMVGAMVEAHWWRYWIKHHPNERERSAALGEWLRLVTAMNRVDGVG